MSCPWRTLERWWFFANGCPTSRSSGRAERRHLALPAPSPRAAYRQSVGLLWFIDRRSSDCALSEERSSSARCGAKGRDLRAGGWLGRGTQVKPCIVNTKCRWRRNVEGQRQCAQQWHVNGPPVGSLESGLSIA